MSHEKFAELVSEIPTLELGGESFFLCEAGVVNARHVVAIEQRQGSLILKFAPTNHSARVTFLPSPEEEPEPEPEMEAKVSDDVAKVR